MLNFTYIETAQPLVSSGSTVNYGDVASTFGLLFFFAILLIFIIRIVRKKRTDK